MKVAGAGENERSKRHDAALLWTKQGTVDATQAEETETDRLLRFSDFKPI